MMLEILKNVDLVLNVYSSISVDAIKYNVPVISLNKFVNWDKAILKQKSRSQCNNGGCENWN